MASWSRCCWSNDNQWLSSVIWFLLIERERGVLRWLLTILATTITNRIVADANLIFWHPPRRSPFKSVTCVETVWNERKCEASSWSLTVVTMANQTCIGVVYASYYWCYWPLNSVLWFINSCETNPKHWDGGESIWVSAILIFILKTMNLNNWGEAVTSITLFPQSARREKITIFERALKECIGGASFRLLARLVMTNHNCMGEVVKNIACCSLSSSSWLKRIISFEFSSSEDYGGVCCWLMLVWVTANSTGIGEAAARSALFCCLLPRSWCDSITNFEIALTVPWKGASCMSTCWNLAQVGHYIID